MNNSIENKEKFLFIIEKYFHIIENKKTNGNTVGQKEKAWEKIRAELKEKIGGQWEKICPKSTWNNMKLQARRYKAVTRNELYKTGGGKSEAPANDPFLEKIACLIGKSAVGVIWPKNNDSDILPTTSISNVGEILREQALQEERVDDPQDIFTTFIDNGNISSWGSGDGPAILKNIKSLPLRQIMENAGSDGSPSKDLYNLYLIKKIEKEEKKIKLLEIQKQQTLLQIEVSKEKLKRLRKERL